MPSVANSHKANGFKATTDSEDCDSYKMKLANKKLDMLMDQQQQPNGKANQADAEVFHDTKSLNAHSNGRQQSNDQQQQQDEEPIVIYDTQSNTSIAQTAKDQFAAALLRLQSGLDESSSRLNAIEAKVDDIVRQQRKQTKSNQDQAAAASKKASWLSFSSDNKYATLLYLSWPVLVFVAMRALEKRALLKRLD